MILVSVSSIVLIQFCLLATNKPAEYARFAILPDIALAIIAFVGIASLKPRFAYAIAAMILLPTAVAGASYVWHFLDDSINRSTRIIAAERLRKIAPATISVSAEPAPYCMPPVDLFRTQLVLNGRGDLSIRTIDQITTSPGVESWFRPRLISTPISWAHKPFELRMNNPATVPSSP